uniref:C-type lectin domain family 4 member M-like n=1 Tax=Doryrhamphus excisus TaxID=161450 RepID=UPI0025ADF073|nr:C-type lectin domain family 4 member M-like [Doryrhamphus excisus]
MPSIGSPAGSEGMFSKLIDEEALDRSPDVHRNAHPVRLLMTGGPGKYRLATICLATLCGVLLISIIAVSAHYKNKAAGGAAVQDVDALSATISKLQQEKAELQSKLAAETAAAGRGRHTGSPGVNVEVSQSTVPARTRATPAPIVCPMEWLLFNGSCYFISRLFRHWPQSQSYCESKGAHLAIIQTAEEQTFLWDQLPRGHWNAYWFGITDGHTEDKWTWVDGTPLVGGFWEEGEPNNHIDEDCGYMVKTRVLERVAIRSWYDAACDMYRPFICEMEMGGARSTALPH